MASTIEPHLLQPTLDFLEGRSTERESATKILRDYMINAERKNDPAKDPSVMLLVSALTHCVKPVFRGDQEKEAIVSRLISDVEKGQAATNITTLLDELDTVSNWFKQTAPLQLSLVQLNLSLPRLLSSLKILGSGVGWLEETADTLIAKCKPPSEPSYPKELADFCDHVIQTGQSIRSNWLAERQTFLDLIAELATHLEEMHHFTGGYGRRLNDAVDKIKASSQMEDLQQLRILLLREAEDVRDQTEILSRRLIENEARLEASRTRLHEIKDELNQTKALSLTDSLTGVANRRAFDLQLLKEINRSSRNNTPIALVIFDLDHFKKVNDTYGHPVGDKVLSTIADRVSRSLRQSDFLARYGGEEFVIILPETDLEKAVAKADKIRSEVGRLRFKTKNQQIPVTISLGVCVMEHQTMTPQDLVEQADQALYRAKAGGRNRVEHCVPQPPPPS